MKRIALVFMLLCLSISQALAQCPLEFYRPTEAHVDANQVLIDITTFDADKPFKKQGAISLVLGSSTLRNVKIKDVIFRQADAALSMSEWVLVADAEGLRANVKVLAVIYPALNSNAVVSPRLPDVAPLKAKGGLQQDYKNLAIDSDGDGVVDLTFQNFCFNKNCAADYVVGELQAFNRKNKKWQLCKVEGVL